MDHTIRSHKRVSVCAYIRLCMYSSVCGCVRMYANMYAFLSPCHTVLACGMCVCVRRYLYNIHTVHSLHSFAS